MAQRGKPLSRRELQLQKHMLSMYGKALPPLENHQSSRPATAMTLIPSGEYPRPLPTVPTPGLPARGPKLIRKLTNAVVASARIARLGYSLADAPRRQSGSYKYYDLSSDDEKRRSSHTNAVRPSPPALTLKSLRVGGPSCGLGAFSGFDKHTDLTVLGQRCPNITSHRLSTAATREASAAEEKEPKPDERLDNTAFPSGNAFCVHFATTWIALPEALPAEPEILTDPVTQVKDSMLQFF